MKTSFTKWKIGLTTIALFLLMLFAENANSQQIDRCGTPPLPESFESWIQPVIQARRNVTTRMVVTLPVVFHVIHNGEAVGSGSNISYAQIESQIEVLNEDFRKMGDGFNSHPEGADVMVEFCLAGVNRVDRNDEGWSSTPYTKCYIDDNIKPATIWDPTQFVNVWVVGSATRCDGTGSLLGYSTWPEGSGLTGVGTNGSDIDDTDGVVIIASSAGRPPANPFGGVYNLGRTLTHELGHFFGLRHTWGDGDCGDDDYCADTPNCDGPYYGCGTATEECTDAGVRMIENYLDYSDDACMNIFTNDQNSRIQAVLTNSPRRMELSTAGTCCAENFATASVTSGYNGQDISCAGASDGSISVTTSGGVAPFTYQWGSNAGNATTASVSGLSAGTYEVVVTDGRGCQAIASVTLVEPSSVIATANVSSNYNGQDISCAGATDGMATASAAGGTPPYTFSWDNGQSGNIAINLGAGTYEVIVSDANSCTDAAYVTLDDPPLLEVSAEITSDYNGWDISCFGAMDGTAFATPSGGTPPYTYSWSNGQMTAAATGLDATTYTIEVTDANGCTATDEVTLTQPDPLTIDAGENQTVYFGYDPAACADISWSGEGGGVPPYTISWSDGGSQTHEVCPEVTTVYTVTIEDANGCIATDEVMICAIDVRCGNKLNKVEICHYPPDNPTNEATLCVGYNSVADHLSHGDQLAACGTITICPPPEELVQSSSLRVSTRLDLQLNPNPFSNSAVLTYRNRSDGYVRVDIVNLNGQQIYSVFNGYMDAGQLLQRTIAKDVLPSGIYVGRIQHEDGTIQSIRIVSVN